MQKFGRESDEKQINIDILNYYIMQKLSLEQASTEADVLSFKKKLEKLKDIKDMDEAKEYVATFISVQNEKNTFSIGNYHGIVLRSKNMFRVILDSDNEYVCYNYINK